MEKNRLVHLGIIGIFLSLYFLVATISMINSVAFFDLAHDGLMNWALAIGFELGAAASLAAIIILDKTNRTMVWSLFILLTAFQMMANSFHAFINLEDYMGWIELFGLEEEEPIFQKRVLSIVSGAILPIVALGFIKSLVDYIRPEQPEDPNPRYSPQPIMPQPTQPAQPAPSTLDQTPKADTPVAGSAEPIVEEIIPEVSESSLEEDLYSRDAKKATIPAEIGKVVIAPETVKTDNADVNEPEKPMSDAHITPVGDPIVIPTDVEEKTVESTLPPATNIDARGFIRPVKPSAPSKP